MASTAARPQPRCSTSPRGCDAVATALWQDRTLVKTWAMRGTLHLLPADELGLWLAGTGTFDHYLKPAWLKAFALTEPQLPERSAAISRPGSTARRAGCRRCCWSDGTMAGIWRHERKGRRLAVEIEPFGRLPKARRTEVEAEAERLAAYLGGELALAYA